MLNSVVRRSFVVELFYVVQRDIFYTFVKCRSYCETTEETWFLPRSIILLQSMFDVLACVRVIIILAPKSVSPVLK